MQGMSTLVLYRTFQNCEDVMLSADVLILLLSFYFQKTTFDVSTVSSI